MNRIAKQITSMALAACLLFAGSAWGASALVNANVIRILTNSGSFYGGCMIELDIDLASTGLNCTGSWVTFSCSGDFNSAQDAKRNFEMAQLAFAMQKPITVRVLDDQMHNGWCFANRVESE